MTAKHYLLIRRTPFKVVSAHSSPFASTARAARAAGLVLYNNAMVPRSTAQKHGAKLAALDPGTIYEHDSGYAFRILVADFTDNGVPITPGLRVMNNNLDMGSVGRAQFMNAGDLAPGGKHFDHWYDVDIDGGQGRQKFDGGRLTTDFARFGKADVSRGTFALGEGW